MCKMEHFGNCDPETADQEYCIFHKPNKSEKEAAEFWDKFLLQFYGYRVSWKSGYTFGAQINAQGFIFPEMFEQDDRGFVEEIEEEGLSMRHGFLGKDLEFIFDDAVFEEDADFSESIFKGTISFNVAQFKKEAVFALATFKGNAYFIGTQFNGRADFIGATFEGEFNNFEAAIFGHYVQFEEAIFVNDVRFDNSTFKDEVEFVATIFCGNAYFIKTIFKDITTFEHGYFKAMQYLVRLFLKRQRGFQVRSLITLIT